jgi:hypothetical protein
MQGRGRSDASLTIGGCRSAPQQKAPCCRGRGLPSLGVVEVAADHSKGTLRHSSVDTSRVGYFPRSEAAGRTAAALPHASAMRPFSSALRQERLSRALQIPRRKAAEGHHAPHELVARRAQASLLPKTDIRPLQMTHGSGRLRQRRDRLGALSGHINHIRVVATQHCAPSLLQFPSEQAKRQQRGQPRLYITNTATGERFYSVRAAPVSRCRPRYLALSPAGPR